VPNSPIHTSKRTLQFRLEFSPPNNQVLRQQTTRLQPGSSTATMQLSILPILCVLATVLAVVNAGDPHRFCENRKLRMLKLRVREHIECPWPQAVSTNMWEVYIPLTSRYSFRRSQTLVLSRQLRPVYGCTFGYRGRPWSFLAQHTLQHDHEDRGEKMVGRLGRILRL
jgi:hypothetical protein